MKQKYVYHSSPQNGLKELKPIISTHGERWVYATKDKLMSAVFLGRKGGDLTCQVGRDKEGKIFITERFKGAFDLRYSVSGSIYTLSGKNFIEDKTGWNEEVVSPQTEKVIKEEYIKDARKYLLDLESKKGIIISRYPEKYMVREDDSDLKEKIKKWSIEIGTHTLEKAALYHPKLVEEVKKELKEEMSEKLDR